MALHFSTSHCPPNSTQPSSVRVVSLGSLGWTSHSSQMLKYSLWSANMSREDGFSEFMKYLNWCVCPQGVEVDRLPSLPEGGQGNVSYVWSLYSQAVASESPGHCSGARALQISSASILAPPLTFPICVLKECNSLPRRLCITFVICTVS